MSQPDPPCQHKACLRHRRTICTLVYRRRRYQQLRALGLPWWICEGFSLAAWARHNDKRNDSRRAHPDLNREAVRRYYQKCKRLYGGAVNKSLVARTRWLASKEKLRQNRDQVI